MSDFKRQLAREFNDSREYREAYAESFVNEYIAAQIKLIRKRRDLSQAQLGELIESNQGRVSIYEDKEYGRWNIETLRRIAMRLGCWLKVSIESYGALLDEAERFSAAGLLRLAFEDDPGVRRCLAPAQDAGDDPFAAARGLVTDWLRREDADLQALCDWLQGTGLPGFPEGEDEFQWILWALENTPEWDELKAILARRIALLITESEIDVRPVGWRPEALLRNLFLLAANLNQPAILEEPLDLVYQRELRQKRELGAPRMRREALSALRTAMERNQNSTRWEGIWFEFVTQGGHSLLPGTVQAGFDGLMHLGPELSSETHWRRLAKAVRELERLRFWVRKAAPGRGTPDLIEELKAHIASVLGFWGDSRSAIRLLQAAIHAGWMETAVAAWAQAVFERQWEVQIQRAPDPLGQRLVVSALFEGSDFWLGWNEARQDTAAYAIVRRAKESIPVHRVRVQAAA
jgi:transcriptional regulator with XRE-family HTH domain